MYQTRHAATFLTKGKVSDGSHYIGGNKSCGTFAVTTLRLRLARRMDISGEIRSIILAVSAHCPRRYHLQLTRGVRPPDEFIHQLGFKSEILRGT